MYELEEPLSSSIKDFNLRFKVGLSPSKKKEDCFICFNENSLKMMKKCFYFILKPLFFLKTFKFLA